jgi:hypothetical protein
MQLAHPLSVQLTEEQLAWLDSYRSMGLSRSAALRLVVEQAMKLHTDGILPSTGSLVVK